MISSNLKEVASFSYTHESHIANSKLEAEYIPVFIGDEFAIPTKLNLAD